MNLETSHCDERRWEQPQQEVKRSRVDVNETAADQQHSALRAVARLSAAQTLTASQAERPWSLGPRKGTNALMNARCQGLDLSGWVSEGLLTTIVRSAPGSIDSAKSALRCWAAFADGVLGMGGRHLPPTEAGLVAWSQCFAVPETFSNYIGYLRMGCQALGLDSSLVGGPLVKRAQAAIKKSQGPPRVRQAVRSDTLCRLIGAAAARGNMELGMLFLTAYTFLLRVPSEGLLLARGCDPRAPLQGQHSCISVVGNELVLRLAKRKNKPHGATLSRACVCPTGRSICPVHVLGPWLMQCPPFAQPFKHISATKATHGLRDLLRVLGILDADEYCLHDFRRGHARDLADATCDLKTILEAGQWTSPAFLKYLDINRLETRMIVQAHQDNSDDEDW